MTTITLDAVAIGDGLGALVPPLSLAVPSGVVSVLAVETDERPMLVSMLLGGRYRADAGRILIDGREDPNALRRTVALVDTPFVVAPPAEIALSLVVAEEFSFAAIPSSKRHAVAFLRRHRLEEYASLPLRALPPADHIRLFSELAILRDGVTTIVVTSPERHGGDAADWYPAVLEIASRGIGVAVITDAPTAAKVQQLGARDATAALPSQDPAPDLPASDVPAADLPASDVPASDLPAES